MSVGCLSSLKKCLFMSSVFELNIKEMMLTYVFFGVWLSLLLCRFIPVVVCGSSSFFFIAI